MLMTNDSPSSEQQSTPQADLSRLLVALLKSVLYKEDDAKRWTDLLELQNRVRDYVATLGLELTLDEAEGYAFLRSRQDENNEANTSGKNENIPRLITGDNCLFR
jgi:hypothetical protein